jgi:predicted Zn-dependent protease
MRAFVRWQVLLPVLLAACGSPATRDELPDAPAQDRPPLSTDEAGLWMVMDNVEKDIRTSGARVDDPALNAYVRGVMCKVAPEYCGTIRLYILDTPDFNAAMAPNGLMVVYTGALLRFRNEAELAYLLAHEATHFQRRHTLQQWRQVRTATSALLFPQIALSVLGLGPVALLADLAAIGSLLQFSREQEREADSFGLDRVAAAGYAPGESADVWTRLIAENEVADDDEPPLFFATHPPSAEREENLRTQAAKLTAASGPGIDRADEYAAATLRYRDGWLRGELRRREFDRLLLVLDQLAAEGRRPGELDYYRGEIYRLRADQQQGDRASAIESYRKALAGEGVPPEAHRSLAEIYRQGGDYAEARAEFGEYLRLAPDAPDRAMIESYLQTLE